MIAILTGDIIRSGNKNSREWMPLLKGFLKKQGAAPKDWEIYRGDAFQLRLAPDAALLKSIHLKSLIKQQTGLDVRISIGIGTISYHAKKITECNGSAFVHSGRTFDRLKDTRQNLAITTGHTTTDTALNLMTRFALLVMDHWSPVAAEIVQLFLEKPDWSQQQIAGRLQINQSAVSQRRKRAQFDLLMDFNAFYQSVIKETAI